MTLGKVQVPGVNDWGNPQSLGGRIDLLVRLAGIAGVGVGSVVLLGWALDVPTLKSVLPGLVLMQPNTAFSVALAGLALCGLRRQGIWGLPRWPFLVVAGTVAAIGLLTLVEHVNDVNLGIDLILFGNATGTVGLTSPGRMALMTAICLACLGLALMFLGSRVRMGRGASQALALTTTLFAMLDLIGYAYGFRFLYLVGAYSTMALHTALTLFVLGLGTLAAQPDTGFMRRFMADDAGGWLLRHLMPIAVILPLLLGGLRVAGEESGLFNPRFGLSVLVVSNIVALIALLWWNAGGLSDSDRERDRAEKGMKEREIWLRTTLNSIGDAVLVTDAEGRVTLLNPVAEALTGWTRANAEGRPLSEIFHIVNESTHQPVENPVDRALSDGVIAKLQNRTLLIARDGTVRAIDDSASPIREGDAIVGVVLVFRDVSDRRRHDHELESRERQFRTLAESIPHLAWMAGPDGTIFWYNQRWYDYTGTTFEQMKGWGWQSVHDPVELPRVVERWKQSIDTGEPFDMVFPLRGNNGVFRPFLTRVMPVADDQGQVVRWFGTNTDITEEKRAEAELLVARSRLDSILTAAEIGTWEFDVSNNVVTADRNLARLFGVSSEEAAGGSLDAYIRSIHPEDRDRVTATIGRALEVDGSYEAEYRLLVADGAVRWVVARGRVERDTSSPGVRMPGVVVDITGRKQAEEQHRRLVGEAAEANAKFRALFDQGAFFAVIMDVDGTILESNRLACESCGYTKEQINGKPFWDGPWWAPSATLVEQVKVASAQAIAGEVFRAEMPYFVAGGIERLVDLLILPIKDESGRIVFLAPTGTDITDRVHAQRQLLSSQERLRFALQAGRMGAWELNLASGEFTCSDTCKANYGWDLGEPFSYDDLESTVLIDDRASWQAAVDQAVNRVADLDVEHRIRWADGSTHWVCVRASCVANEAGRTLTISGVSFNIDDRKRAERLLIDADRRKDEFLATLAHELRNPLAPIRNGLQIMKMAGDDRVAVEESRGLMERQVTHMVRLIDDLMDVSRITRGKLELRRDRVELSTVVQSAVETSRPLVEEAGHELSVTLPTRPILIDADVTRLAQVFSNLLNNAAKYTERGGDIALVAERQGSDVVVTVRDNGVGIPSEMLPEVFAMFTQVPRSLEFSQGGLGIGLSLVKTLVEMHGGSVEARSGGHGQGSEFIVRLPVVLVDSDGPSITGGGAGPLGPSGALRILVVDDNEAAARTLARLLKLLGHEARTAHDGGEAVEVAENYRPELMLLDIGLPVMNGYDVARAIRQRPWGSDLTIVALTGWGQEGDRRRSKEAGIDDHLVKPVDPTRLEEILAGLRPGTSAGPVAMP